MDLGDSGKAGYQNSITYKILSTLLTYIVHIYL